MAETALDDAVRDGRCLTVDDLAGHMASGCKPETEFRIGSEHEKFVFHTGTHEPVEYGADARGRGGIQALLEGLTRFGWTGVYEDNVHGHTLIALQRGGANISLEPGGQFELSGAPLDSVHGVCEETTQHLDEAKAVGEELGLGFLALGYSPLWTRAEVPVMPKARYDIMRAYMPKVGKLGLDMMLRTSTVQANLDFSSEADMIAKFRVSLALQPIATALFANSPFVDGKPSGLLSSRAHVWTDTDPNRTGMLDFVFADGFGFDAYARYALDVPMYFIKRDGRYIDATGLSFRDFIKGESPARSGDRATLKDWSEHLSTIFPEVRLKTYLEMRGADTGPQPRLCALAALWIGLFYDQAALAAAWDLCKDWSTEDHNQLRADVARLGLKAQVGGRPVRDVARDVVAIAREGLKNRGRLNGSMSDERGYLAELEEILDSGLTPAERLLELYHGPWRGQISPVFEAAAY
ncbi:MAG TPA: glutamate--cysteine ligase [Caulobacteraceae bacterium]|nr:glutamate--cysteine ligase [Caulobacteraceae bacterium]